MSKEVIERGYSKEENCLNKDEKKMDKSHLLQHRIQSFRQKIPCDPSVRNGRLDLHEKVARAHRA
mgnify:CR=1 FL=1